MLKKITRKIITGINPSGEIHIGNYIGAIKPTLRLAKEKDCEAYFFIANHHSLTRTINPKARRNYTYKIAAALLALGLDVNKNIFYLQSDISEILELNWILTTVTPKGLLNRSHSYKFTSQYLKEHDIKMGIFSYPILMSADILMFDIDFVTVGVDQIQHIEITRNIARSFNNTYDTQIFKEPKAIFDNKNNILPGIDGKKMSKSYGNTIPLFCPSSELKKLIMKIKTTSQNINEPKMTKDCTIFSLFRSFATDTEVKDLKEQYQSGISWKKAKDILFEKINSSLEPYRKEYEYLINNKHLIKEYLENGKRKARERSRRLMLSIKKKIGISI